MSYNHDVDRLRGREYPMLGEDQVYLDHGGTTLYAKSLIEQFQQKMLSNLYGNPHSASAPATLSGQVVDEVRLKTLEFFGADPKEFDLVFVQNATAAIKLVMEAMRDLADNISGGKFRYFYHKDAHTSIVGVREVTNIHYCFKNDDAVEAWLGETVSSQEFTPPVPGGRVPGGNNQPSLFAYPGQSNLSGRRLPLSWCGRLRRSTHLNHQNAYSLFDAAALAVTSPLAKVFKDPNDAPDFTCVSFYKIFGFPDLGGLIVRKKSGHVLTWRKYFGGGTVNMVTVLDEAWHYGKDDTLHEALEDGTLPFHNIMALGCAIDVHRQLFTSMERISAHTSGLVSDMHSGLRNLRHLNGKPLCVVYTDHQPVYDGDYLHNVRRFGDPDVQGPTIAFNVLRADGSIIPFSEVDERANHYNIYLRAGGLCNPGGVASYLDFAPWQIKRAWSAGHRCGGAHDTNVINGKPTGVIRVSLGAMSSLDDVVVMMMFLERTFVEPYDITRPLEISNIGLQRVDEIRQRALLRRFIGLAMDNELEYFQRANLQQQPVARGRANPGRFAPAPPNRAPPPVPEVEEGLPGANVAGAMIPHFPWVAPQNQPQNLNIRTPSSGMASRSFSASDRGAFTVSEDSSLTPKEGSLKKKISGVFGSVFRKGSGNNRDLA